MALVNQTNKYHLYYLLVNDIREDWFEGLSHVAEHTLLIPTDIGMSFIARGYTCMSHVCLYFQSDSLEMLQEIDERIMRGDIITDKNVRCAKNQVTKEIINLHKKTAEFERIVGFVTENRVRKSVIGNPEEIESIQLEDIARWFWEKQRNDKLFRFIFKDANNMIFSTAIPNLCEFPKTECEFYGNPVNEDSFLYIEQPFGHQIIQAYLKIPSLFTKKDVIKKAFYEFCARRKVQDKLEIELIISDVFFSVDERYILAEFTGNSEIEVMDIIRMIRKEISSISVEEIQLYGIEFMDQSYRILSRRESNYEVMNAVKNSIIYSIPQISFEDLRDVNISEYLKLPYKWIEYIPLKVVVSK